MLRSGEQMGVICVCAAEGAGGSSNSPALAGAALVAGHMAATAVEAGVVDLAPFGALFLLSGPVIFLVAFVLMLEG